MYSTAIAPKLLADAALILSSFLRSDGCIQAAGVLNVVYSRHGTERIEMTGRKAML
jgi:hypothetical protein